VVRLLNVVRAYLQFFAKEHVLDLFQGLAFRFRNDEEDEDHVTTH